MATASNPTDTQDVVRRGVKRTLPCKLTDEELLEIARNRVAKEALRDQIEADFLRVKKRHTDQVEELEDEDGKMRRELHTGEQDRTVPCNEYFRRDIDGTGWIHTVRMDTLDEVERRPATPAETQRFLPTMDAPSSPGPQLDLAAAPQAVEPAGEDDGVPEELEDDGDEPDDDGLTELTPAQRAARESAAARKARRAAGGKGKRGGKGKA